MGKNENKQAPKNMRSTVSRMAANSREVLVSVTDDPLQGIMAGIIVAAVIFLLVLGGLSIWPYIIANAALGGVFAMDSVFDKLALVGLISGTAGVIVAVYLCWFYEWDDIKKVSLIKIWLSIHAIIMLVNYVSMPMLGVELISGENTDVWTGILSLLVHGLLGIVMAVVPGLLISLAGYFVNRTWFITHKHLL